MLQSTFVFLKGNGESTERCLWEAGIRNWHDFLASSSLPGIATARKNLYDEYMYHLLAEYQQGNFRFFARCLKPRDHWRLFDTFRTRTVFLDIETTGEPAGIGYVTLVGLYANGQTTTLIRNETLTADRLESELSRYDLIVTFFGTSFDVPYLRTTFPTLRIDHAHFDLCFAARRLGLRGGLKHIEQELGLARSANIQGLDGWDAVRLWRAWENGQTEAKALLCDYNEADVRNLEPLAEHLYAMLRERSGFVSPYQPSVRKTRSAG
ncbi:MAG: exonuclease [Nitrospirales bacterium]|nr:exonuclease [Nitrospirales bacterium]